MRFEKESVIRASPERVFAFHEQANVLSLLIPPWESAHVIQPAKISEVGTEAIIETTIFGPIKIRWVARHTLYDPPHLFEDVQVKGPFRSWRHRHIIESHAEGAILRDEIDYEPPLGFLGRAIAPLLVQKRLQKLFDYRHEVTRQWCEGVEVGSGQWAATDTTMKILDRLSCETLAQGECLLNAFGRLPTANCTLPTSW